MQNTTLDDTPQLKRWQKRYSPTCITNSKSSHHANTHQRSMQAGMHLGAFAATMLQLPHNLMDALQAAADLQGLLFECPLLSCC